MLSPVTINIIPFAPEHPCGFVGLAAAAVGALPALPGGPSGGGTTKNIVYSSVVPCKQLAVDIMCVATQSPREYSNPTWETAPPLSAQQCVAFFHIFTPRRATSATPPASANTAIHHIV